MYLESVVLNLFYFQLQLKIYHWQTFCAPRHRAAENLLEKLQEFTDNVVEFYQGRKGMRLHLKGDSKIMVQNVVVAGEDYGEELIKELCAEIEKMQCSDQAIENKRQEFLGEVERTLYLFTLE